MIKIICNTCKSLKKKAILLLGFSSLMIISSCKKFIDIEAPFTSINSENVFSSDATASSVLTGIYQNVSDASITSGSLASIGFLTGMSSDELTLDPMNTNQEFIQYYRNAFSTSIQSGIYFWTIVYPIIYSTNAALEGISSSSTLTPSVRQQLLGESKFIRALCYFYLVNFYGDVPLILGTDYNINANMSRTKQADVWAQIIADLKEAQTLLNDSYVEADAMTVKPTTERVRPNKATATALLARAYLFLKDYQNAALQSTSVITNPLYNLVSIDNIFLKNSKESIWQLYNNYSTKEGQLYILPASGLGSSNPVYLNDRLVKAFSNLDLRKGKWMNSVIVSSQTYYYSTKYKGNIATAASTEYNTVFRLAEQYLIRAEAKVYLNDLSGALSDLNMIRSRAGLADTLTNSPQSTLGAINKEKQLEFFLEWGHRWLDLKRTGAVDAVMNIVTPLKANGQPWQSYQQLYPIPLHTLKTAPNIIQNPGY